MVVNSECKPASATSLGAVNFPNHAMPNEEGEACCLFCSGLLGFLLLVILLGTLVPVPVPGMLVHRVENDTLYTLELDNSASTLTYNLSVVFSFNNPLFVYDAIDLSVAKVTVALLYGGEKMGAESSLPTFELEISQTAMIPFDAGGQQITGADVARTDQEDAARGYYTIEAKLHLQLLPHRWCDSSCVLYFLPPTSLGGGRYMFDGEDCQIYCKKRGFILY